MNGIPNLLEVNEFSGIGYKPMIDYGEWRVALLRYHPELLPENITAFQRHDETDEVFVLLEGQCLLFLGEGDSEINQIHTIQMLPSVLYNVKKSCWHSHTLSKDALVLIVENKNTTEKNSPTLILTDNQRNEIIQKTADLWRSE